MPLNSGEVFAGYVIERLLGTGGMGEVYLAQHPRLPRHDALKILTRTSTADGEFQARFIREAELAATLRHPNIVGVLDRGEFDGKLWISMDYVDGTDAGRLIRERYRDGMPEHDVTDIVTAVADALDFGHERRLLHRDVKPENILVTASDGRRRRVLLTDFGIARSIDDVSNLTDDNVAVGTVNYMAPEQLLSRPLDGRADQYALAATTFHLLTGAPPFHDSNRAVVISHHLGASPPRISDRRPDLAHLDAVLARALAKDADERYPTCLDFAQPSRSRARAARPIAMPQPNSPSSGSRRTAPPPSASNVSRSTERHTAWAKRTSMREGRHGNVVVSPGAIRPDRRPACPAAGRNPDSAHRNQTHRRRRGRGQRGLGRRHTRRGHDRHLLGQSPPRNDVRPGNRRHAEGHDHEAQNRPDGGARCARRCGRAGGGCGRSGSPAASAPRVAPGRSSSR